MASEPTLETVGRYASEFTLYGSGGPFRVRWLWSPSVPTLRAAGVTGWAEVHGETVRVHVCAHTPCQANHSPSKYGVLPPPRHGRLAPGAVAEPASQTSPAAALPPRQPAAEAVPDASVQPSVVEPAPAAPPQTSPPQHEVHNPAPAPQSPEQPSAIVPDSLPAASCLIHPAPALGPETAPEVAPLAAESSTSFAIAPPPAPPPLPPPLDVPPPKRAALKAGAAAPAL